MRDPFTSSRLIYRGLEFPNDKDFFFSMSSDTVALANSQMRLLTPVSKSKVEQQYKEKNSLLSVVVCIPVPILGASVDASNEVGGSTVHSTSVEKPKPIPIGTLHMRGIPEALGHHRCSMVGINILAAYQNKGYGTEAIEWALGWGFQTAGLHRMEISCYSWNEGARRLYARIGFVQEGRHRENVWYQVGWHDIIDFAMLENEWRETKGRLVQ